MALAHPTRKRKRGDDDNSDDEGQISITLSDLKASQLGPVLASFPALQPSKNTAFQCYLQQKPGKDASEQDFASQSLLLAGENSTMEFFSTSETASAGPGCKYLIGVHNKKTNTVTVRPAPMHVLTRRVKALKGLEPAPVSSLQRLEARNLLGETFGTKKAVRAIHAAERNKVDVSAMEGVTSYIQDSIEANTTALPSNEEAKAAADSSRLIPRFNPDAQSPAEVYAIHDIIPEAEFNAIPLSQIISAPSRGERTACLPYTRCKWVNQHLDLVLSTPKPNKSNLKLLFYVSAILAFRSATFRPDFKQDLHNRMPAVPPVIVDGLLSRFTETARDSSKTQFTTQNETNLLTHLFALCLRVDDFATDTSLIAADLSMAVTKVNLLFRSLGCKIEALSTAELHRLGLPDSAAGTKRALLKTPLQFPKPRAKRRT